MSEADDQLIDEAGLADRARERCDHGVGRPFADEPGLVELAHAVEAMAAGHGRDVGEVRRAAHGRHGCLDVARLKLGEGVGVEYLAEGFALVRHRFRSRATFDSITSQIVAAMSFPPNCAICLMPVGEVTLISVR